MAVENTKATAISNADSLPRIPNSPHLEGSQLLECVGTVEVAAADDDGSVYRMARVRSNARISQVLIANDAITGATSYDCGVYDTADNGGAAVDDDLFFSAVDINAGNAQWTDLTHESASNNIADCEKRLWEILQLSADPHKEYDICLTADTVGSGAGTISMLVRYVK